MLCKTTISIGDARLGGDEALPSAKALYTTRGTKSQILSSTRAQGTSSQLDLLLSPKFPQPGSHSFFLDILNFGKESSEHGLRRLGGSPNGKR